MMLPAQSSALVDHKHARATPGSVGLDSLGTDIYGTTTVAIDPDDAAAAGTAATLSRSDHAHEFLTASAAALTKTATSGEGTSGDGARADHVHATSVLPWGLVTRQVLTSNSSGFTASGATDMTVNPTVDVLRAYEVTVLAPYAISVATGRWIFTLNDAGTVVARLGDTGTIAAGDARVLSATALWLPATGTPTLDVRLNEVADGSTITFFGSATEPRQLFVKDIGPR